ncbi:MAG TPA: PEGA domain-containing protein [Kofleriaceae bacterium]|nr:PEGA domain-containing protein [Kofleriaceae bacterium]
MRTFRCAAAALALGALASTANADDAGVDKARLEAKALLQSGNTFYDQGAYAQALDLFRAAYARYPSTKLLFNIGKTLEAMGRHREAAATFDAYLARPDVDPARRGEIVDLLRALEPRLGTLVFASLDDEARVTVDGETATPAGRPVRVVRIDPGDHTVRVEKPGFLPFELTVSVGAGEAKNLDVRLSPEPPAPPQPRRVAVRTEPRGPVADPRERSGAGAGEPRAAVRGGRLALTLRAVVDHELSGAAVQPGLEVTLSPRVSLVAAATVGPTVGGYAGARARLTTGRLRPLLAVGAPIFAFDGVRFGVRGAGGVEAALGARVTVSLELGIEHYVVKDRDLRAATVFAPAAAINARL